MTHGHPVFFHRNTWRELMTVSAGGARAVVHAYGARAISVPVRDAGVVRTLALGADVCNAVDELGQLLDHTGPVAASERNAARIFKAIGIRPSDTPPT